MLSLLSRSVLLKVAKALDHVVVHVGDMVPCCLTIVSDQYFFSCPSRQPIRLPYGQNSPLVAISASPLVGDMPNRCISGMGPMAGLLGWPTGNGYVIHWVAR